MDLELDEVHMQKMELTNNSEYECRYNSNMELDLELIPSPTLAKVRHRWEQSWGQSGP